MPDCLLTGTTQLVGPDYRKPELTATGGARQRFRPAAAARKVRPAGGCHHDRRDAKPIAPIKPTYRQLMYAGKTTQKCRSLTNAVSVVP